MTVITRAMDLRTSPLYKKKQSVLRDFLFSSDYHSANWCRRRVCDGLRGLLPILQNLPPLLCGVAFCRGPIAQTPNPRRSSSHRDSGVGIEYAHSVGLGRSTAGDLLDAELVELGLQLLKLLGEVLLVLAPELTSLDLGRLETVSACISGMQRAQTYHGGVLCMLGCRR